MTWSDQFAVYSRRRALQFLAGASTGLLLHACSQSDSQSSISNTGSEKMSLAIGFVTWIGMTPLHIAVEKGFFKDLGLDLKPQIFGTNTDLNAAFLAGQLDVSTPVTSAAVLTASKGKDFRIILVQDNSVGGDGILARNSIESIETFKGKEIAVEKGAVSHFFLLQVLAEAGLSEADVTLVNADATTASTAYQTGQVEIAVSYAPFLQQANEAQPDGRIIFDTAKMPTAISDFYVVDRAFAEANPRAIDAFVKGIFQGRDFLEQNPQEGLAIAAKALETTPDALEADLKGVELPDAKTNLELLDQSNGDSVVVTSLKNMANFMIAQKQIESVPDLAQMVEPKYVDAYLKQS